MAGDIFIVSEAVGSEITEVLVFWTYVKFSKPQWVQKQIHALTDFTDTILFPNFFATIKET